MTEKAPSGYDTNPVVPQIPSYPDNTSDVIPDITPNVSALSVTGAYALSLSSVKALFAWLMTDDYTKNISELFSDKLSAINSLRLFPFDIVSHDGLHVTEQSNITIANVTSDEIPCWAVLPGYNMWLDGGEINYLAYYGDYNDYVNCRYSLYIPYGGIVDLSPSHVINRTLSLRYAIDLLTGNATALIRSNGVIVKSIPCNLGQSIPIIFTNANAQQINKTLSDIAIVNNIVGAAASVVQGSYTGAARQLVGAVEQGVRTEMTNPLQYGHIGTNGSGTGNIMPQTPFLVITRGKVAKYSSNYAIGTPTSYYGKISNFAGSGLIKANTEITIATATVEEEQEIRKLLESGILI